MAEVIGIITGIYTSGQALENFATQIRKWHRLSERLLDIREELYVAEIAVKNWKRKYRVENQPGNIKQGMLKVLFGRDGAEHITTTLGTIATLVKVVRKDINALIGRAIRVRPGKMQLDDADDGYDEQLVEDCIRRIKQNLSWSQKFVYSVFGKADELEKRVNRLDHKIGVLERLSDLSLETEHPGIYEEMKRMPGRKIIPKLAQTTDDGAEKHLRMRKYAELLHKTSRASQLRAHIGLSVPRVDNKDFDFLLNVNGTTQEVIVRPVRFKTGRSPSGAKNDFEAAFPAMRRLGNGDDALYIQPSMSASDGFKITLPALTNLVDLEHKESLSVIIRDQGTNIGSQILYPQDQSAVASGIARGSFRLIGSQWLDFLDCTNIRWRRTRDGDWTSMLTATNGNRAITKELEACLAANSRRPHNRDLTKHIQIFRIGLVLAELALKQPISYLHYDVTTNNVKVFINGDEEVDAVAMASLVDKKSNILLGNMVFFCLHALQNQDVMASTEIEDAYYRGVTKDARELETLVKGRRGNRSPVAV